MSLNLFNRLEYIDYLICSKNTGKPKELADKLEVSERALYDLILLMKNLGAPISYCRQKKTYYYLTKGTIKFRFQKDSKEVSSTYVKNQLDKVLLLFVLQFNLFVNFDSLLLIR